MSRTRLFFLFRSLSSRFPLAQRITVTSGKHLPFPQFGFSCYCRIICDSFSSILPMRSALLSFLCASLSRMPPQSHCAVEGLCTYLEQRLRHCLARSMLLFSVEVRSPYKPPNFRLLLQFFFTPFLYLTSNTHTTHNTHRTHKQHISNQTSRIDHEIRKDGQL